jgi:beta-N-acetylhexosaminidase
MRQWRSALVFCALIWLVACAGMGDARFGPAQTTLQTSLMDRPTTLANRAMTLDPEAAIDRIIHSMTLDQKVGQLMMVEIEGDHYDTDSDIMIRQGHIGGVIIYNNTPRSYDQMQQQLTDLQAHSAVPLLAATDQEGYYVSRLDPFFGDYGYTTAAAAISQTNDPAKAYAEGGRDAKRMLDLGFNVNLAPVADVGDSQVNMELLRLWSTDVAQTDKMAGAYLDGLQANGVAGTLKHWPGIGTLMPGEDPDQVLRSLNRTADQLQRIDMAAFKGLLAHGPALIMVTAVKAPVIDPIYPATLSQKLINGILRGQLGYQGVIITDSLHQGAIYQFFHCFCEDKLGDAAVLAVEAGDDVLEGAFDVDPQSVFIMEGALKAAVQSGKIPLSRIEESDRRILRLKWAYGIGSAKLMKLAGPDRLPGAPAISATPTPIAVAAADIRHG